MPSDSQQIIDLSSNASESDDDHEPEQHQPEGDDGSLQVQSSDDLDFDEEILLDEGQVAMFRNEPIQFFREALANLQEDTDEDGVFDDGYEEVIMEAGVVGEPIADSMLIEEENEQSEEDLDFMHQVRSNASLSGSVRQPQRQQAQPQQQVNIEWDFCKDMRLDSEPLEPLPDRNIRNYPQENLRKLKNYRNATILLAELFQTPVSLENSN